MRLLYAIPYYLPARDFGGPVAACAQLAEAMAGRGHSVTVLTTDAASRSTRSALREELYQGVRVVRLRNWSQRLVQTNLFTPRRTRSTLARLLSGAELVHVHEFFSWLCFRAATDAARRATPVLLSAHGSLSLSTARGRVGVKRAWMQLLGRRTIAASSAVQAASSAEAEQCVRAGVPRAKLRLIPQGVAAPPRRGDGAAFRARYALGERPILLFVGRLARGKGVDLLLATAAQLAGHPARPLIVLAGPAERRPDLATPGLRAGGGALITGALAQAELQDAYAAASAFVLPSAAEGMPVAALDALAFGLPVLLSPACNLPEVASAGAGLLVEPELASLQDGIQQLLAQRAQWPQMGQAARRLAAERFSLARVLDEYECLYRELAHA